MTLEIAIKIMRVLVGGNVASGVIMFFIWCYNMANGNVWSVLWNAVVLV